MLAKYVRGVLLPIIAVECIAASLFAVEVTEPAGAAHGYPGLCDINGKKLADGEFRQWLEGKRLHVAITYQFPDGQIFEEHAQFLQQSELMQEKWSWRELKNGQPEREFAVDLLARTASAHVRKDNKDVSQKIEVEPGRTFAGFGFSPELAMVVFPVGLFLVDSDLSPVRVNIDLFVHGLTRWEPAIQEAATDWRVFFDSPASKHPCPTIAAC